MPRCRNIKPGLAKNEVLAELGPHAQLLFALLPCYADREGRLEDRPKRLKAEIFPYYDVDVDALLQSLADCEEAFVVRYEIDGNRYLQITNFDRHQAPHHKEQESAIPCLAQACVKHGSSMTQAKSTLDNPSRQRVKGSGIKEEGIKESERQPPNFEDWWNVVHLRKGKEAAKVAYAKAIRRLKQEGVDAPHEFLCSTMRAFAASPEARPPDRTPIHPTTWLNQGRYHDDPATWQASTPQKPKGIFS